ncbi:hypothetical protein L7F22_030215 [Adiantum nelumboides]|nr:hypothetical protein [Adiantum nelumboides]
MRLSSTSYPAEPWKVAQLKVPAGDGPYVRAKQIQLLEKDPERAIALFWTAINAGDRVDSALKDMAVVMKQQNRGEEAIQAILSFRHLCSPIAQESLDNVLLDLYKGNLGWAYMQLCNYVAAEAVYRKALSMEEDSNKLCNLGVCLLKQGKQEQAAAVLERVTPFTPDGRSDSESHVKSYQRSRALLHELTLNSPSSGANQDQQILITPQEFDLWTHWKPWEAPINSPKSPNPATLNLAGIITTNPAYLSSEIRYASNQTIDPLTHAHTGDDVDTTLTLGSSTGVAIANLSTARYIRSGPGSFKREIGPSNTVHEPNRAKKTPQGHDKRDFGLLSQAEMKEGAMCMFSKGDWVSSATSQERPGICEKSIRSIKDQIVNDCDYNGDDFGNARNQVIQMDVPSLRHEYQAQWASSETSVPIFSCDEKVIESVVSVVDVSADAAGDIDSFENSLRVNKSAMEERHPGDYHQGDQITRQGFSSWPAAAGLRLQSLTGPVQLGQHRLKVFQDMTPDTGNENV